MVGLVSCLGLDVPSQPAPRSATTRERCVWCEGRPAADAPPPAVAVVEESPMPEGLDAFAAVPDEAEAAPIDPDAAFQATMIETLDAFRADLAAVAPEAPGELIAATPAEPQPAPVPEPESVAIEPAADDLYPGLAYALNREAEGLVSETPAPTVAVATAAVVAEPVVETPVVVASRGEKVEAAVRLTGQALHAWLSVFQTPAVAYEAEAATVSR
jgi:hypothetical protein